jgi:hypothetical protein
MSKIQLIPQQQLDIEKWDQTLRRDPYGNMYGHSWYLDLIAEEWDGLVYGDYEVVMPLVKQKKWGLSYIGRPYGAQQLGIYSRDRITKEMVIDFLTAVPKTYKWVDLYLNQHNPLPHLPGYQFYPQTNIEVSLEAPYPEVYKQFNTRTKRNLKKSAKYPLNIFEHDSPDVLIELFKRTKGQELTNLHETHYAKVRHIMYVLLHKKRGFLWTVYGPGNALCAGAFLATVGDKIVFLFSASDAFGRESHAMTFLLNELFKQTAGQGFIFDFEGSNLPGLQDFYGGFGGTQLTYYRAVRNNLPWPLNYLKR